jgi:hypothetical protein
MEIETALKTYLLAQNSLTEIIGQRIYYIQAIQSTEKPYIIIERPDDPGVHTSDGPVAVGDTGIIIGCYGTTWISAREVAAVIKAALNGKTGVIGGVGGITVNPIFYEDESSGFDTAVELYYVDLEFTCQTEG